MSEDKDSELLILLQPELLTAEQLIAIIRTRCSKVQNVTSLSKERLVGLFRQVILPLPQRRYRANRRGKLLTARRVKCGLERGEERTSSHPGDSISGKRSTPNDRLKPAPDSCTPSKIRITSSDKGSRSSELDKIVINDRRGRSSDDAGKQTSGEESRASAASSSGKVALKRTSSTDKCGEKCSPEDPSKKKRIAIKWP